MAVDPPNYFILAPVGRADQSRFSAHDRKWIQPQKIKVCEHSTSLALRMRERFSPGQSGDG